MSPEKRQAQRNKGIEMGSMLPKLRAVPEVITSSMPKKKLILMPGRWLIFFCVTIA